MMCCHLKPAKFASSCTLLLGLCSLGWAQGGRPPFAPEVLETPWGQRVVPTLETYIDLRTYEELTPGQEWSAGEPIVRKLREDYRAGRLKLRRYPWRVTDGVFALGRDNMEQQIYLIDTGQGLLLIDPSFDAWQEDLLAEIRLLGYDPSQVKWALLTHCHIDHSQACHAWHARGTKIVVGDADAHPVETCNALVATWVEPEAQRHCTPSPVDQHVYDGDALAFGNVTLHAIWTPGHTPGATCYYMFRNGKHILISGDIVLHNGRHAWMGNPYADWEQYLTSLGKLADFALEGKPVRFDILLPGHGTVDIDDAQRSVEETVRVVRNIVARRGSGERIDWIDPYSWNWEQGIRYTRPN
jgi:glyoxylase-like metal-dependent hydrolase (beta-lactamase superfamily II)